MSSQSPIVYSGSTTQKLGSGDVWSAKKLSATFLHQFNLRNYPFDRQKLQITFEDSGSSFEMLELTPHTSSGYDKGIVIDGWRLSGSSIKQDVKEYRSNFGNPSARDAKRFSRVILELELRRNAPWLFVKTSLGLFAAVFIAILGTLMSVKSDGVYAARITLSGGMLLAVVISHQFSDTKTGQTTAVTLIDSLHMLGIAVVALLFMMTFISRKLAVKRPNTTLTSRLDLFSFLTSAVVFGGLCLFLVFRAANPG